MAAWFGLAAVLTLFVTTAAVGTFILNKYGNPT